MSLNDFPQNFLGSMVSPAKWVWP